MVQLKTRGIITVSEYHQACIASQFTIAKTILCCYCPEPVKINPRVNETLLVCPQHGTMRLEVGNTEYRGDSISQPMHGTMSFYLHRLNGRLFAEDAVYLAENKGCPFCQWNLQPGTTHIGEVRLKNQLLNDPLYCNGCDISFLVIAHQGELRFQPKPEHLLNDIETTAPQTRLEDVWLHPQNAPETNTAETAEVSDPTPTETATPAISEAPHQRPPQGDRRDIRTPTPREESLSDTLADDNIPETPKLKPKAHSNEKKDIQGQILAILPADGSLMKAKDLLANIGGRRNNKYAAIDRLIDQDLIERVGQGWYRRCG